MLAKCPSCKRMIDIDAIKCGYCLEPFLQIEKDKIIQENKKSKKSCFGCITVVLFLFLVIIFAPKNQDLQNNNQKQEVVFNVGDKMVIKKETKFLAAYNEDDFEKANVFLQQQDYKAFDSLVDSGRVFILPRHKTIFIVNYHPFSKRLEVRFEGQEQIFWISEKVFK